MKKISIAASTLPPLPTDLNKYLKALDKSAVDYIHCDVIDGKFVGGLSLSPATVKDISKSVHKPLDVHLMVSEPSTFTIAKYTRLKPAILSVHFEAYKNKEYLKKVLMKISKKGVRAGLAIRPDTSVEDIKDIIPYCGHFLIMSVTPGLSGQKAIESCFDKITEIKAILKTLGIDDVTFSLDGGASLGNINRLISLGYDIAISGKALYIAEDRNAFIDAFTTGKPLECVKKCRDMKLESSKKSPKKSKI